MSVTQWGETIFDGALFLCILVFTRFLFNIHAKVHIFRKGHKNFNVKTKVEVSSNFCGLLRKPQLYTCLCLRDFEDI